LFHFVFLRELALSPALSSLWTERVGMDMGAYSGKGRKRTRAKQKWSVAVEVNEWFLADPGGGKI
jgi:hypothetical protein